MTDKTIIVIGLGYVGLPLAVAFGKKITTIGYDISEQKVEDLKKCKDVTGEVSATDFEASTHLSFTSNAADIARGDYIIVAVPTPIDNARRPDLRPVEGASEIVGKHMKKGAVVVYESTVYPGVTEDICVPTLERFSNMKWMTDFHVGYSPERINPGDREHTLTKIVKIVAGDDAETLDNVASVYESIIEAGVYRVESIKEAEAAKVIENTQRDLNIALMNELSIIFDRMEIDTTNVLKAAGTKWNFLPFKPGLVGGHCIGVDPYYLTHKAEMLGYQPQVILAGRRINDNMGTLIAQKTVKMMINAGQSVKGSRVGVLGLTFKENCPDLRNTRVTDIIGELKTYGIDVFVHDPMAEKEEALKFYDIQLLQWDEMENLDAIILAVGHDFYHGLSASDYADKVIHRGCLIDVKSIIPVEDIKKTGLNYWRL